MSINISRLSLLLLTGCWLTPSYAGEIHKSRYECVFPAFKKTASERAKIHKVIAIGQASFKNSVVIPVFGVTIENPMGEGLLTDFQPCTVKTCTFNMTISAAQANQLLLYQVEGVGMFLAPKTWKNVEAAMGPSGIASLMMSSPDGSEALSIYNTSACVGCSLSAASLYFPEARRQAIANDFTAYKKTNVPVNKVALNKYSVAYSYQLPQHYQSNGIAKFYGMQQDIVNYNQMTVSLSPEHKALATTILNFYHLLH